MPTRNRFASGCFGKAEFCLPQATAILGKMAIKWPDQTREFFDVIAIVNFNTEMFRLECILGRSEPIKAAILTALSPFGMYLLGVLAFAIFVFVRFIGKSRSDQNEAATTASVNIFETISSTRCGVSERAIRPAGVAFKGKVYLQFQSRAFLASASWSQYLLILCVVSPSRKWPLGAQLVCIFGRLLTCRFIPQNVMIILSGRPFPKCACLPSRHGTAPRLFCQVVLNRLRRGAGASHSSGCCSVAMKRRMVPSSWRHTPR